MGLNSTSGYKSDYKISNCELPRFVPPMRIKFIESEIDIALVQPVLDIGIEIEEDSGAYMLVGSCEDKYTTEIEEEEGRKGIGEGNKVCV
ncbi:hypothetical protein EAE96_001786 [Botrytis aclada]|nr:hypothetical protein EAE96_001786 [Botrytis aclada]